MAASTNGVGQGQYQESYTYGPTGNLLTKNGVTYGYSDPAHVHAVTHLTGTQRYWYDANGNMTSRTEKDLTYTQVWNAENRPSVITTTPTAAVTRFWYDGDGALVKKEVTTSQGVTTTLYLSQLYEVQLTAPAGGTGQSTPPPLPLTAAPATSEAAGRAPTRPAPDLPPVRWPPIPLVPTPVLYPLPAYTAGTANTVEWEFDETLQYQARRVPTANCDDEAAVDSPWLGQGYYVFTGLTHGVTYYYCVMAWDPTRNLYSEWAGPIFSTQDAVAPTAQIGALPEYHWQNTVTVSWSGSDDGSGLAATPFEVQFQQDGGAWQPWLYTPNTTSTFTGVAGHVYTFRVRSQDQAGNLSAWSVSTPIMLTFSRVTIYYYFNGQRIAVRERTGTANTLTYLHADALGRASLATTVTGTLVSQRRYLPYGETRWSSGPFPTDRRFTGQREEVTLGVYDYGARFYSPGLGRFLSADTLVPEPESLQGWNRYTYVDNNPIRYSDPTGHTKWVSPSFVSTKPGTYSGNGEATLDALGFRLDASFGLVVAVDVNVEFVITIPEMEYAADGWKVTGLESDLFISLGGQGPTVGGAVTAGPVFITDLPSLNEYPGITKGGGVTLATPPEMVGVDVNYAESAQPNSSGKKTGILYIGGGFGFEGSAYYGKSNTYYLQDACNLVVDTINSEREILPPVQLPWQKNKMHEKRDVQ